MTLLIGCLLSLVGSGTWTLPLASWLSAVFLLRYTRDHALREAIPFMITAMVPVVMLSWNLFPFGGPIGLAIFAIVAATMSALPYLLDRVLAPGRHGWARLLVFPVVTTGLEWASQQTNDLGSWGAASYTQVDVPGVLQMVSVTGLAGPTFLLGLFATVVNGIWESSREERPPSLRVVGGALLLAAAVLLGQTRLLQDVGPSVRVAGISGPRWNGVPEELFETWRQAETLEPSVLDGIRAFAAPEHARLWEATEREARAGARLVAWSEGAMVFPDTDREPILARGRELAASLDITLVMTFAELQTGPAPRRLRNQTVIVTPDGVASAPYTKSIATPGDESSFSVPGDRSPIVVQTPIGRVATVICYDADFPGLVAGITAKDVDLLVIPAGDWDDVATLHADMARFRAVEQGVSVLRVASDGESTVLDPYGRVWGRHRWSEHGPDAFSTSVPVRRVQTLYSRIGDLFGMLLALLTGLGIAMAAARTLRRR